MEYMAEHRQTSSDVITKWILDRMNKSLILLVTFFVCSMNAVALAEQSLTVNELRQDFIQLYEDLKASHINLYEKISKEEYDQHFEAMLNELSAPMGQLQARIAFQKFIALGRVAHARIDFPSKVYQTYRDNGGVAFPIYVKIDPPRWFIEENYSDLSLPEKAEITHIDGLPVSEWLVLLHNYISADTLDIAASLLEFQLPQYLWLVEKERGEPKTQHEITLRKGDNTETHIIKSISRDTLQKNIDKAANKQESPGSIREFKMLSESVAYLKPGPFYNAENPNDIWNNSEFVAFVDNAFRHFIDKKALKLIIDVRNNPGGTNSFSDPLIAWFARKPFRFASAFLVRSSHHAKLSNDKRLEQTSGDLNTASKQLAEEYQNHPYGTVFNFPMDDAQPRKGEQFKGEVFVLIDRSSYSNAVSLAAIVKDYGFGTVIGESTTDFATTLASMETFTLKHSGIEVGFPKGHIIRPSGDKKPGPVHPDIELSTFELDEIIKLPLFN